MIRQTSIDAYHAIMAEDKPRKWQKQIYAWLYDNGPATQSEVCKSVFPLVNSDHIKPRFAEMKRRKMLRECGKRRCKVSGRIVLLWDVTDHLPTTPLKQEMIKCPRCSGWGKIPKPKLDIKLPLESFIEDDFGFEPDDGGSGKL